MSTDTDKSNERAAQENVGRGQSESSQGARESTAASGSGQVPASGEASAADADSEAAEPAPPTAEEELARVRDQLLRTHADFDNYRKRARRDVAEAERRVQESLIRSLLPTFDNIERASVHAESTTDVKSLAEGLQMVLRQFQDTLAGLGIERVASAGQAFDPSLHEAVQHVETSEVPAGAVAQELQPGYRWNGRLLRPAMVVVAKTPAEADAS